MLFDHVSFGYPGAVSRVFTDLSVHFTAGWTAVTGPNGGGKSTLLKLACRLLAPESGSISGAESSLCLYCEQESVLPQNWQTWFWSGEREVRRIFSLLRIDDDFPERWNTLSGGEKKRLQIACALCEKPLVFALDEPTNHLDTTSMRIIVDGLKAWQGTGLLVSHNRDLMEALCQKTFYIGEYTQVMYEGSINSALAQRAATEKSQHAAWQTAQRELRRTARQVQHWTEEAAKTPKRMSKSRLDPKDRDGRGKINLAKLTGKDASAAHVKARLYTRLVHNEKEAEQSTKPPERKRGVTLDAGHLERDSLCVLPAAVIRAGNTVSVSDHEGEKISYTLSIPELTIVPTSRIALTGENGGGKTLLIRRILSEITYNTSAYAPLAQNGVVYIPQEIDMEREKTYLDAFYALNDNDKGAVLSQIYRLGSNPLAFLSSGNSHSATGKECGRVSPGELRKLIIAYALQTHVSFLILDEPTNHLDLDAVLVLESALRDSSCALLLCSHDEAFIRSLAAEIWRVSRTSPFTGILTKGNIC